MLVQGLVRHNIYEINVGSIDGSYSCSLIAMDQSKICHAVHRLSDNILITELEENNVFLNDLGEGTPEIEILIGADYFGSLLTGKVKQMPCGLVAVETHFGWTVMGCLSRNSNVASFSSLYCCNIAELWELETLGIEDPANVQSRSEILDEVHQRFRDTVKIDDNGRYEISLPWARGHPELIANKHEAMRRFGICY